MAKSISAVLSLELNFRVWASRNSLLQTIYEISLQLNPARQRIGCLLNWRKMGVSYYSYQPIPNKTSTMNASLGSQNLLCWCVGFIQRIPLT